MTEVSSQSPPPLHPLHRRLQVLACASGLLVASIGAVVLTQWLLGQAPSQRGTATSITMKTNASLALILTGISLSLQALTPVSHIRAWVGRSAAVIVLLIGSFTLSQHLFGWDLAMDQLLATEPPGAIGVTSPNRMGLPGTSACVLSGLALVLLTTNRRRQLLLVQVLGLAVCGIALLPSLGYLYGAEQLHSGSPSTAVALPSAVALLALGAGLLLSRPDIGIIGLINADDSGGRTARQLLPALLIYLVAIGWLKLKGDRYGIYPPQLGTTIRTALSVVVISALVLYAARRLSRSDTARRRAEDDLRDSESRLRAFYDSAPMLMGIVELPSDNRDIIHLYDNPATNRFLNQPALSTAGRTTRGMGIPQSIADLWIHHYRQSEQRRSAVRFEYEHPTPEGNRWLSVTVSLLGAGREGRSRFSYVAEDITDRKRAEDTVHAARRSAEEASRAKDHFLAVLSHELRTPLTPVIASLSILDKEPDIPDALRGELAMIQRNVELEARLIDDLLDLTRIARGKITLDRHPVAACTIMEHVAQICAPDVEARDIQFDLQLSDCPAMVNADPARLQQVFWNLIKNSIKFTPHGGRITVRLWREDQRVVTEVTDTGRGIDPALLPRIFDAFEQGSREVTRQFGGLGLGLAICRAMVELHGGTISAHSEGLGRGARFTVRLPAIAASAAQALPESPQRGRHDRPGHAPLRVLLVEDHGDTARIMKRILTAHGHEVTTAGDVATALDTAKGNSFDVLVSDLGLPDRSGLDLIQDLRAAGSTMPAIAISGYGQDDDLARSRAAGFQEHLIKPVDVHRLEDAIARAVSDQHGR